jgi:hypothetical protein
MDSVYFKQELLDMIPVFVEKHYPKNDTAAHGGPATPGRGEATVLLTRFIMELSNEWEDNE